MAGIPGRGGQNRLTVDEHRQRGTLRPARHLTVIASQPAATATEGEKTAALKGLSAAARTLAHKVLAQYSGWDAAGLQTLRSYALSVERLRALESAGGTTPALEREVKINLQLLRALNLEAAR